MRRVLAFLIGQWEGWTPRSRLLSMECPQEKVLYFYSIVFSSVKPKGHLTRTWGCVTGFPFGIHGTRCPRAEACISSLRSFLGSAAAVLRRLKEDAVTHKDVILLAFKRNLLHVCAYARVCASSVWLCRDFALSSPPSLQWSSLSKTRLVPASQAASWCWRLLHRKALSLLLPFHCGIFWNNLCSSSSRHL